MTSPSLFSSGGISTTLSDPLSSLFSSAPGCGPSGDAEWDWSNNLIEFPPPFPSQLSAVPSSLSTVSSSLSTVSSISTLTTSLSSVDSSLSPGVSPTNSHSNLSPGSQNSHSPIHSQSPMDSSLSPVESVPQGVTPTPSPEQQINPPTVRKRRKREINLSPEMYNIGFEWVHYNSPASSFQIYDPTTMQLITNQFDIVTHKVESNTHFSAADNAWICYRQNQFKIVCFLKCPQPQPPMAISDSGVVKEVHQLCVKLYAIKELSTLVSDEARVGMHHVGRARVKKEKQEINVTPFVNGRVEFANVQFEKSNSVKGQQLEYFRLVMAFYAKAGNAYFHIFSKQSPRLIVRSQNPGFYGDTTGYNYSVGVVPGVPPVPTDATVIKSSGRVGSVTGGAGIIHHPTTPTGNNISNNGIINNSVNSTSNINNVNNVISTFNNGNNINSNNNVYTHGDVKVDIDSMMAIGQEMETERAGGVKRMAENIGDDYAYQVPSLNPAGYVVNFDVNNQSKETDHLLEPPPPSQEKKIQYNRDGASVNVFYGKVGVNVDDPAEALTVRGNVLVHGDLFKPSDQRIKSDIVPVDSSSQLDHIRELKIYDYKVSDRKERGVLAQELQKVMPNAVHEVGDVIVDNHIVPNLLTVNERSLLYENIGATQQLDKEVECGKRTIVDINTKVEHIAVKTSEETASVRGTVQSMLGLFFEEESNTSTNTNSKGVLAVEEEFVNFGFSLFRMGPARTLLVLGHFFPYIWAIGALFVFSNIKRRRLIGICNLFLIVAFIILTIIAGILDRPGFYEDIQNGRIAWYGIGMLLLLINYIRLKKKLKQEAEAKGIKAV